MNLTLGNSKFCHAERVCAFPREGKTKCDFKRYISYLYSDDNRLIINGLHHMLDILEKRRYFCVRCQELLNKRLDNLLTHNDEVVRRCVLRLCVSRNLPALDYLSEDSFRYENDKYNQMLMASEIFFRNQENGKYLDKMSNADCKLTKSKIELAKFFSPKNSAKGAIERLSKKQIDKIINNNDATELCFLATIYNMINRNCIKNPASSFKKEIFSDLLRHDNINVQKFAMTTFNLQKSFSVRDLNLDCSVNDFIDNLDLQPKKWALTNIWRDQTFIKNNYDYIKDILDCPSIWYKDDRVKEGIARGLSLYVYDKNIATNISEWYFYERSEAVKKYLERYLVAHRNRDREFQRLTYDIKENNYKDRYVNCPMYEICHSTKTKKNIIQIKEEVKMKTKFPKIFISHSSKDAPYVKLLVELFEDMGLWDEQIFCSSLPGYNIPNDENIFDYLKKQFLEYDLYVFFIHSENYYNSIISLNEMGAAWALKTSFTSILLPHFDFDMMNGVVRNEIAAIKLDNEEMEVKDRLNQVYDKLKKIFNLKYRNNWEEKRNRFITEVLKITSKNVVKINDTAFSILSNAGKDSTGQILVIKDLSGTVIQAGSIPMNNSNDQREIVKMEAALEELIRVGFVVQRNSDRTIFQMSKNGYDFLENQSKKSE